MLGESVDPAAAPDDGVAGKGLNDDDALFRILAEHQYRGWVSIEDGMDEMAGSPASLRPMGERYFPE